MKDWDLYSIYNAKSIEWLKKAATELGIPGGKNTTKTELINRLIDTRDTWLTNLKKRLNLLEQTTCSVIVAEGGSADSEKLKFMVLTYLRNHFSYDELDAKNAEAPRSYLYAPSPIQYIIFQVSQSVSYYPSYGDITMFMPREFMKFFTPITVVADDAIQGYGKEFIPMVDFQAITVALIEYISIKSPKMRGKYLPFSVTDPVFNKYIKTSELYKIPECSNAFTEKDFNRLMSGFLIDTEIELVNDANINVDMNKFSVILSDSDKLREMFCQWYMETRGRDFTVFGKDIYDVNYRSYEFNLAFAEAKKAISREFITHIQSGKVYDIGLFEAKLNVNHSYPDLKRLEYYNYEVLGPNGPVTNLVFEGVYRILEMPFALLGIILLGPRNNTEHYEAEYFKINEIEKNAPQETENSITFMPDFEVLVMPGVDPFRKILIFNIGEPVSVEGGRTVVKLDRVALLNALLAGKCKKNDVEDLIKNKMLNVPDNVKITVLQWLDRYGEAEIVSGTIIKCRNEFMAQSIAHDVKLKNYINDVAGKYVIINTANPKDVEKIMSKLASNGYMPVKGAGL